jgi:branched-chain amino acid transport system permease protein
MSIVLGSRSFLGVLFTAFAVLPLVANQYVLFIGNLAMLSIILSVGLNLLIGVAGQFAFASAAMYGIGAYTTGLLQVKLGTPYWLAAPAGAMLATGVGTLLAFPALRVSGIYLALATLAFAQVTQWVMVHWETMTFGAMGFRVPEPSFGMVPLEKDYGVYYLSWIVTLVMLGLAWRITRSRVGRAFVAMRDGEVAAEALGISLLRYKAIAFALSGFYAGTAGALYAAVLDFVSPDSFTLFEVIRQQAMVVVGGMGSILGSVLGAVLLVLVNESVRRFKEVQEMVFGAVLLAFVLFRPEGMIGLCRRWLPGWDEPLHDESRALDHRAAGAPRSD